MTTVACPECDRQVRPCNLERHRRTHYPTRGGTIRLRRGNTTVYTGQRWLPAKRPIARTNTKDRLYDEVVPRGEGPHRFRIYRMRAGELDLLATAEDPPSVGVALYHLDQDGEFVTDDATGVLDTLSDPGHWLVHPYALGRTPRREAA